jgi:hypothetical protein
MNQADLLPYEIINENMPDKEEIYDVLKFKWYKPNTSLLWL